MRFQIKRHLGHLAYEQARSRKLDRRTLTAAAAPAPASKRAAAGAEFDPQDYVSFLLYIDAEIEHGLMVQYLYAAYSLGGSHGERISISLNSQYFGEELTIEAAPDHLAS